MWIWSTCSRSLSQLRRRDLVEAREERVEIAEVADQFRRGLLPDQMAGGGGGGEKPILVAPLGTGHAGRVQHPRSRRTVRGAPHQGADVVAENPSQIWRRMRDAPRRPRGALGRSASLERRLVEGKLDRLFRDMK